MNASLPSIVVLDDYEHAFGHGPAWDAIRTRSNLQIHRQPLKGEALFDAVAGADVLVLMRDRTPLPAALIDRLPRLKLLVFTGTRNLALDAAALARRGIPVCHTGWGPSKDSTAELTWTLILAAHKRLLENHAAFTQGRWRSDHALLPVLKGETLGLIGLGEIGSRVAAFGRAFGMKVLAWSPRLTPERAAAHGAECVPLETLLAASRVVSLHLVVSPVSRHLINAERMALMRRDAILVNTSRSALIRTDDLLPALEAGRPAQAVLDVFDEEPLPMDSPLRGHPQLLLSPHLGFVAQPVFERFVSDVQECLVAWLDGRPLPRPLPPSP